MDHQHHKVHQHNNNHHQQQHHHHHHPSSRKQQEWTPSTGYVAKPDRRLPKCYVPPLPSERAEILAQAAKLQYDTKTAATHIQSDLVDMEAVGEMTLEDLYEQRRQMDGIEETLEENVDQPLDDAERMHTRLESWIPLPHNKPLLPPKWRRRNHEFLHEMKEKAVAVGEAMKVSPQQQQQQQHPPEECEEQEVSPHPRFAKARRHMRDSITEMNDAMKERIVPHNQRWGRQSPPRRGAGRDCVGKQTADSDDTTNNSGKQDNSNQKLTPEEQEQLDALHAGDQDIEDMLEGIGKQMDHVEIVAGEMGEETKRHGQKLERLHHRLDHAAERQRKVNHRTKKLIS